MIEAGPEIRKLALSHLPLAANVGARMVEDVKFPDAYTPTQGPLILFSARGGDADYSTKVLRPSYQFRCYAATAGKAHETAGLLFDAFNDHLSRTVISSTLESFPQPVIDLETNWPFVLSFYRFLIRNA